MATFKVLLHASNKRKNGTYPVSLRIIKNLRKILGKDKIVSFKKLGYRFIQE
jgi:hypothetical protein